MKSLLVIAIVFVCSSSFAKTYENYLVQRFPVGTTGTSADCLQALNALGQVSSPTLSVQVNKKESCRLHQSKNESLRKVGRVLADVASYGTNEIGCKHNDGVGCGSNESYINLEATIKVQKGVQPQGRPYVISAKTCSYLAKTLSGLHFTANSAQMVVSCNGNVLQTTLVRK